MLILLFQEGQTFFVRNNLRVTLLPRDILERLYLHCWVWLSVLGSQRGQDDDVWLLRGMPPEYDHEKVRFMMCDLPSIYIDVVESRGILSRECARFRVIV